VGTSLARRGRHGGVGGGVRAVAVGGLNRRKENLVLILNGKGQGITYDWAIGGARCGQEGMRVAGTYRRGVHICPSVSAPSLVIFARFVRVLVIPSFASLAILIGTFGAIRFCRLLKVVRG
jgi:hypothetical protein